MLGMWSRVKDIFRGKVVARAPKPDHQEKLLRALDEPTMWSRVKDILREKVLKKMRNPRDGEKWLHALDDSDAGRHLAVCITIDVLSHALDTEKFVDVLDNMDVSDAALKDACGAFGKALIGHAQKHKLLCASLFGTKALDDDEDSYLRILTLVAFIEFYAAPTWPGLTIDEVGQRKFKNMFFTPGLPSPPLGMINQTWGGPNGIVWVTSYKDYERLSNNKPKEEISPTLNDALGINHPTQNYLLGVKYPKNFDTVSCHQPTALDAGWVKPGSFYLSYRKYDNWGRTHSCSGLNGPARERVHWEFEGGLTNEFRLLEIGEVAELQADRDKLLVDAFRRVQALLDAQDLEARRLQP